MQAVCQTPTLPLPAASSRSEWYLCTRGPALLDLVIRLRAHAHAESTDPFHAEPIHPPPPRQSQQQRGPPPVLVVSSLASRSADWLVPEDPSGSATTNHLFFCFSFCSTLSSVSRFRPFLRFPPTCSSRFEFLEPLFLSMFGRIDRPFLFCPACLQSLSRA
ncbi:hypothetical protein VTK73DRAFT_4865 [Phialemonium thermophilum]|uniref:Uncharacterized protein n=1 Tax=Phialemonium thermophilum TaxID=223376 RepID=A0ABR3V5B1_9PEZI